MFNVKNPTFFHECKKQSKLVFSHSWKKTNLLCFLHSWKKLTCFVFYTREKKLTCFVFYTPHHSVLFRENGSKVSQSLKKKNWTTIFKALNFFFKMCLLSNKALSSTVCTTHYGISSLGWNLVFWPPRVQESYTSLRLASLASLVSQYASLCIRFLNLWRSKN